MVVDILLALTDEGETRGMGDVYGSCGQKTGPTISLTRSAELAGPAFSLFFSTRIGRIGSSLSASRRRHYADTVGRVSATGN